MKELLRFDSFEADRLPEVADALIALAPEFDAFAFHAPMGAGKTTLISAIARRLGVEDEVNSPTFAIVNEYLTADGDTLYHFDCYRLKNIGEALDIGAEDYFNSGSLSLIEWPDVIEPILPDRTLHINIAVNPDDTRSLVCES